MTVLLPVVILPLIFSGLSCASAMAAKGRPQLATKSKYRFFNSSNQILRILIITTASGATMTTDLYVLVCNILKLFSIGSEKMIFE